MRQDWMPSTPHDWTEDFTHENGNYECRCIMCKEKFYGHKRRHVCKTCAGPNWSLQRLYRDDNPTAKPMNPSPAHQAAEAISDFQEQTYGVISPGFAGPCKRAEIERMTEIINRFIPEPDAALAARLAAAEREIIRLNKQVALWANDPNPESDVMS